MILGSTGDARESSVGTRTEAVRKTIGRLQAQTGEIGCCSFSNNF